MVWAKPKGCIFHSKKVHLSRFLCSSSKKENIANEVLAWNNQYHGLVSQTSGLKSTNPKQLSELNGKLLAIKDNFLTKNFPTTCNSGSLNNYQSEIDATVVKKLQDDFGMHVIGKTSLDEFGMGSFNLNLSSSSTLAPPLNPQFKSEMRVTGGSSGGSAAIATDNNLCYASLGSDTGGSVRLPASYCSVYGFKPSYGRISRFGLISYASSLDTVGILSHKLNNIKTIFRAVAGYDPLDPTTSSLDINLDKLNIKPDLRNLCIGIPKEYYLGASLHPKIELAWRECIRELTAKGVTIKPVSLPNTPHALATYYIIAMAEASSNMARYNGITFGTSTSEKMDSYDKLIRHNRSTNLGWEVQRRILLGTRVLSAECAKEYFLQAQKMRRLIKLDFDNVFTSGQVDCLLVPTALTPPPTIAQAQSDINPLDTYLNDVFTVPSSLAGLPAISFPFSNEKGIGLQLIGPMNQDESLLEYLGWFS